MDEERKEGLFIRVDGMYYSKKTEKDLCRYIRKNVNADNYGLSVIGDIFEHVCDMATEQARKGGGKNSMDFFPEVRKSFEDTFPGKKNKDYLARYLLFEAVTSEYENYEPPMPYGNEESLKAVIVKLIKTKKEEDAYWAVLDAVYCLQYESVLGGELDRRIAEDEKNRTPCFYGDDDDWV